MTHDHDRPTTPYQTFVYYFDFVLYPAIVLACLIFDRANFGAAWVAWFVFGFFLWTFAEYWIHRVVLHGPYWMGIHERHHGHPAELTAFPIWQIPAYFAVIGVGVYYLFGSAWPPVFAGIVGGFVQFGLLHHLMHQSDDLMKWPWLYDFARRHAVHHKVTFVNYGITTDIWDRVFGTYREVQRRGKR